MRGLVYNVMLCSVLHFDPYNTYKVFVLEATLDEATEMYHLFYCAVFQQTMSYFALFIKLYYLYDL